MSFIGGLPILKWCWPQLYSYTYVESLNSLDYFEMQNHLSANMIRIMLLEDQNKDLPKIDMQESFKGEVNLR